MRGRRTLTDLKIAETLAKLRAWLVERGEAKPQDGPHAAAAEHWDRHMVAGHPKPCLANPCKSAAVSAVILELLTYGQAGPALELLDTLATDTEQIATALDRLPRLYAEALEPIQRALQEHRRKDEDGHYRYRPFKDGRVLFELPQLVAEGLSLGTGLGAAALSQGPSLRAFAAKLRELALWPGSHDARTKAPDHLLISATQHLDAAGFDASEIANLIIDEGDRQERPHARHCKTKKRSLPVDRVRQRLLDHRDEDFRIIEIPTA